MDDVKKKRKMGLILMIIFVIGIVFYFHDKNNIKVDAGENAARESVRIQSTRMKLVELLGEDTPYPDVYALAENLLTFKDYSKEEAAEAGGQVYLEQMALEWYAEKKGLAASEAEIGEHTEKLIEEARKAENYKEIKEECEKLDLTVEDLYRSNPFFSKTDLVSKRVYRSWEKEYNKQAKKDKKKRGKEKESWKKFIGKISSEYKNTEEYQQLEPALRNSVKAFSEDVPMEKLNTKGIFIE